MHRHYITRPTGIGYWSVVCEQSGLTAIVSGVTLDRLMQDEAAIAADLLTTLEWRDIRLDEADDDLPHRV